VTDPDQAEFADYYLSFSGKQRTSNRWMELVLWDEVER